MEHLINNWPTTVPGVIALGLAMMLVKVYVDLKAERKSKDVQGKDFLQMFAEAQSDAFAQIKESDKTMNALVSALTAVKEQGERLEDKLQHLEDRLGR